MNQGAFVGFALQPDFAFVCINDSFHQAEAQTATTNRLHSRIGTAEELLEDARLVVVGDPDPGIPNMDEYLPASYFGFDVNASAAGCIFDRVFYDVIDGLRQMRAIPVY